MNSRSFPVDPGSRPGDSKATEAAFIDARLQIWLDPWQMPTLELDMNMTFTNAADRFKLNQIFGQRHDPNDPNEPPQKPSKTMRKPSKINVKPRFSSRF